MVKGEYFGLIEHAEQEADHTGHCTLPAVVPEELRAQQIVERLVGEIQTEDAEEARMQLGDVRCDKCDENAISREANSK